MLPIKREVALEGRHKALECKKLSGQDTSNYGSVSTKPRLFITQVEEHGLVSTVAK